MVGGAVERAHVLTIVIAAQDGNGFAVSLVEDLPGTALDVQAEGRLVIDATALAACGTPRAYGQALGEALLTGPTLAAWQRARARGRERLHVVLDVQAPELRALRWERLCAPYDGGWDFVRCDQRTPFTLRVASQSDRTYAAPAEPRALVLVASPSDLEDYGMQGFDTLATIEGVRAALVPWAVDVLAFAVPGAVGPPTLEGLCEQLTARAYSAVHVVCHGAYARGSGEAVLYLADDDETTAPAPASKLLRRLGRLGGDVGLPLLWFLAACESAAPEAEGALGGLSARLGRELGAPAVIAMSERVSIDTAGALIRPFYRQLRAHGHVDLALAEACSAVAERSDVLVPVLHARAAGTPTFLPASPSGQVARDMSEPTTVTVLSESPVPLALGERCVGRGALLAELRARLVADPQRPPALALVAPGGLGKTRVALELLWQHRALFPGGVFWLDAAAPGRIDAVQHALLRQLQPDAPSLAELQRAGVAVSVRLAAAARSHRPGAAQLWVLDHVSEDAAGGGWLARLCPRWGEVAVLVTSRMRPDDEGVQVLELEALNEADGAALLTAGLPAGSMSAADAAEVVRWVGGMPLALELLARSLDLGDLTPAEVVEQARTARVAQALTETQQVLRTAGAGAGLSPLIESLRLSYDKLSPEAQGLARRIAQFGPEPLPTPLIKALGPAASRLARATLAARSFVTGISGQRFGAMHRVLADFLRGLCGPEEPAEACAALLAMLPYGALGEPERWPELTAVAVHAEALLLRCTTGTPALVELGNRVGVLYQQQTRYAEAQRIQRRVVALAEAGLEVDDGLRIAAVNNLAMTTSTLGDVAGALKIQTELTRTVAARRGPDDRVVLLLRQNTAAALQAIGELPAAHAILVDVVARRERLGPPDDGDLLGALSSLGAILGTMGDLAAARAVHERVLAGHRGRGPRHPATLMAAKELAATIRAQRDLAGARALLGPALAAARTLWAQDHLGLLELRELHAMLLADEGDTAGAMTELVEVTRLLTGAAGADHPRTLHLVALRAGMLLEQGEPAAARAVAEPALALARARHGLAHSTGGELADVLANVLEAQGELAAAHDLIAAVLAERRAAMGADHPAAMHFELRLAEVLGRMQAFPAAHAVYDRVHAVLAATLGPRDANTLLVVDRKATLHLWAGEVTAARDLQAKVLADSRAALGPEHFDTLRRASYLGQTLMWLGEADAACEALRDAEAGLVRQLGAQHFEALAVRMYLGLAQLKRGALAEAEALLPGAYAGLTAQLLPDHGAVLQVRAGLARLRVAQGRLDAAAAEIAAVLPRLRPAHAAVFTEGAFAAIEVAMALAAAGRASEGLGLMRDGLALATAALGADHELVVAGRINLSTLQAAAGDVRAALALLDGVDASVARLPAGHPLAAAAADQRARLTARL